MRGQAQVWKAKSALTARPAAPLTRRPPPPWQSARRPCPRKLFSAAPPRSAPVPRAAGIVTEVPGAPRGERPVAAPNQRGRRNDCEGIGRRGRRAQRGRREPAYPASSSDRKLKLFKRLPLDSDTALVGGEVMGMSQERAGGGSGGPGRRLLPTQGPPKLRTWRPVVAAGCGSPVQAPGAQPQRWQPRGHQTQPCGHGDPGARGVAQNDRPPARPRAARGLVLTTQGRPPSPPSTERRWLEGQRWGKEGSPWRPRRGALENSSGKARSGRPRKTREQRSHERRGSGDHGGDTKQLSEVNAREAKSSSRTRKPDRLGQTAAPAEPAWGGRPSRPCFF